MPFSKLKFIETVLLQGILSDMLKCLGDNKKHMRECVLNTLDSWLAAVHLDKMVYADLVFCHYFALISLS